MAARRWLLLCGSIGLACSGLGGEPQPPPVPLPPGGVEAFEDTPLPGVGQCMRTPGVFSAPEAAACDGPHDAEVIAVFSVPAPRPDESAMLDTVIPACEGAFAEYVGVSVADSRYRLGWHVSDTLISCTLSGGESLTGSAKGTGQ